MQPTINRRKEIRKIDFGLLKHLFAVLDHEVANSRQFGEFVSLDAPVEADAQDVAEAMVEEEVFEFYQPDDTVE